MDFIDMDLLYWALGFNILCAVLLRIWQGTGKLEKHLPNDDPKWHYLYLWILICGFIVVPLAYASVIFKMIGQWLSKKGGNHDHE